MISSQTWTYHCQIPLLVLSTTFIHSHTHTHTPVTDWSLSGFGKDARLLQDWTTNPPTCGRAAVPPEYETPFSDLLLCLHLQQLTGCIPWGHSDDSVPTDPSWSLSGKHSGLVLKELWHLSWQVSTPAEVSFKQHTDNTLNPARRPPFCFLIDSDL